MRDRVKLRYQALRSAGVSAAVAREARVNAKAFTEAMLSVGADPGAYPELTRTWGKPASSDSIVLVRRRRNYKRLKDAGMSANQASNWSRSPGYAQYALRRLQQGLPVPHRPAEVEP